MLSPEQKKNHIWLNSLITKNGHEKRHYSYYNNFKICNNNRVIKINQMYIFTQSDMIDNNKYKSTSTDKDDIACVN